MMTRYHRSNRQNNQKRLNRKMMKNRNDMTGGTFGPFTADQQPSAFSNPSLTQTPYQAFPLLSKPSAPYIQQNNSPSIISKAASAIVSGAKSVGRKLIITDHQKSKVKEFFTPGEKMDWLKKQLSPFNPFSRNSWGGSNTLKRKMYSRKQSKYIRVNRH